MILVKRAWFVVRDFGASDWETFRDSVKISTMNGADFDIFRQLTIKDKKTYT